MIPKKELERRLDADNGYLREKIRRAGEETLYNIITSKRPVDHVAMQGHLEFLARTWVDNNGDVISAETKERYYERLGFVVDVDKDVADDLEFVG